MSLWEDIHTTHVSHVSELIHKLHVIPIIIQIGFPGDLVEFKYKDYMLLKRIGATEMVQEGRHLPSIPLTLAQVPGHCQE